MLHPCHLFGEVLVTGGLPQLSKYAGVTPSSKRLSGFHEPQLSVSYSELLYSPPKFKEIKGLSIISKKESCPFVWYHASWKVILVTCDVKGLSCPSPPTVKSWLTSNLNEQFNNVPFGKFEKS